ncbi:MAG TPA: hypothetical protein VFZ25_00270 [Chloroflexota bacterium]|nr:hypothetical protein [Chloroflexota bacterium]
MKKLRRSPVLIVAVLATLIGAIAAVGIAGAASPANRGPCPASWYPMWAQSRAIQQQCSNLKQQAIRARYATAAAAPRPTVLPPTPGPESYPPTGVLSGSIPDDAKPIQAEPTNMFAVEGVSNHLNPVTSVWQAGVVPSRNHSGYARILVYAAGPNDPDYPPGSVPDPSIARTLFSFGAMENIRPEYDHVWTCPRPIGSLTITGITGQTGVVSFTSSSGVSGSLDMSTGTWSFGQ